ncbi:MAG: PEGA domain-containing protein [Candidatus Omnitrophica bacterium]|nr:PEGA domain-containing protein [Candidatus Omnitrophota bacterium]
MVRRWWINGWLVFLMAGLVWAQEGYLRVTSVPDGASVSLEGKGQGKTPLLLVVKPGKYTLAASLAGYTNVSQSVEVLENEVTKVHLTLVKMASRPAIPSPVAVSGKGKLTVLTDWPDVDIYLDGLNTKQKTPATLSDIQAGLHFLILVSGDYAMFDRIWVQANKTNVVRKSFEEYKKKRLSLLQAEQDTLKQKEIEEKRQKLPAKLSLKMEKIAATTSAGKSNSVLLSTAETVTLTLGYRKAGSDEWMVKEIKWEEKEVEPLVLEKGTYEFQLTATRYRESKGLVTIIIETKKEKVAEGKTSIKKELLPDTLYTFNLAYDGAAALTCKIEEKPLNTPIE